MGKKKILGPPLLKGENEVFMDITDYWIPTDDSTGTDPDHHSGYLKTTGITAAAGMGTNLYLAKRPWTL